VRAKLASDIQKDGKGQKRSKQRCTPAHMQSRTVTSHEASLHSRTHAAERLANGRAMGRLRRERLLVRA